MEQITGILMRLVLEVRFDELSNIFGDGESLEAVSLRLSVSFVKRKAHLLRIWPPRLYSTLLPSLPLMIPRDFEDLRRFGVACKNRSRVGSEK